MDLGNDEEDADWVPFHLTFVTYKKGDLLGQLLAITSLSPLVILISLATLSAFRRDLHTLCLFIGQILNEALNAGIKLWVKEPRPPTAPSGAHFGKYGFPSSHTQFMWFFCSYITLFLFIRLKSMQNGQKFVYGKWLVSCGCLALTLTVSFSRIYLGHHSWRQVWCGAAFGCCAGLVWFLTVNLLLTPLFPWIVSWPICEWLLIRDFTLIPNVLFFEYTCCKKEAQVRQRKLSLKLKHHQN